MQKMIVVKSTVGLHASLAAKIVKAASRNEDVEYVTNRPTIIIRTTLLVIGVILATVPFIVSLI